MAPLFMESNSRVLRTQDIALCPAAPRGRGIPQSFGLGRFPGPSLMNAVPAAFIRPPGANELLNGVHAPWFAERSRPERPWESETLGRPALLSHPERAACRLLGRKRQGTPGRGSCALL